MRLSKEKDTSSGFARAWGCGISRPSHARAFLPKSVPSHPLMQSVQARRVGQTKSGAKRQHINGWEDGRKRNGACAGRPRLKGLDVERYAALAFLTAVGFAGFGWAFAVVFLAACALSFAANSALTFWAIASVSTL